MANIKNLKKDIDYLVSMVVVDCLQYVNYFENADINAANKIIENILVLRSNLRKRTSHPDGKNNPKLIKSHFQKIGKDLMTACDKAYEELGKLIEK